MLISIYGRTVNVLAASLFIAFGVITIVWEGIEMNKD